MVQFWHTLGYEASSPQECVRVPCHETPSMNSKDIEKKVEVILDFVLGIVGIVLGSRLIAGTCNLVFPTPPNSPGCELSGSNLLGLVGLVLAPIGVIAVVASISVLIQRKY